MPPNLSAGLSLFVVYRVRTPVDFRGIFTASAATGADHQQFFTLQYEQVANQRVQLFGRSIQPNQVVIQRVELDRDAVRDHHVRRRRCRRRTARSQRHWRRQLDSGAVRDARRHGPGGALQPRRGVQFRGRRSLRGRSLRPRAQPGGARQARGLPEEAPWPRLEPALHWQGSGLVPRRRRQRIRSERRGRRSMERSERQRAPLDPDQHRPADQDH